MAWYDNINPDTELILPVEIKQDNEYVEKLFSVLDIYVDKLRLLSIPEEIIRDVRSINQTILESLNYYYGGKIPHSLKGISNVLSKFKKQEVIISDLNKSFGLNGFMYYLSNDDSTQRQNSKVIFYKARLSKKVENYSARDMIHIPFSLREKVASQRFSVPGLPCVYLGTSSYVCWLELDRPIRANFNASAMILDSSFRVLNLVSSWDLISRLSKIGQWGFSLDKEKLIRELIVLWPLVCATSFKVRNNDDRSFKSEYVISQLLMQVVSENEIDGICYYSKRIKDSYAFPHCINVALPAKFDGEKDLSSHVKSKIEVINPINFEEFSLLKDSIKREILRGTTTINNKNDAILAGISLNYMSTEFYEFDSYLRNYNSY